MHFTLIIVVNRVWLCADVKDPMVIESLPPPIDDRGNFAIWKRVIKPRRAGRGKNMACSKVCLLPLRFDPAAGPHHNIAQSLVYRHDYSNICPNDGV
ncbi:hypothetical protein EVAR_96965_1 [Eumeta japonica]|uniref:Uncharacterized protein n=1 Tax=Eumeta variegata TaxID=151549 RepID=A0A4C1VFA5_EUMVA|nr:hypothetical protein EVAR_96965_1 [Eumeta japonica]